MKKLLLVAAVGMAIIGIHRTAFTKTVSKSVQASALYLTVEVMDKASYDKTEDAMMMPLGKATHHLMLKISKGKGGMMLSKGLKPEITFSSPGFPKKKTMLMSMGEMFWAPVILSTKGVTLVEVKVMGAQMAKAKVVLQAP